MDTVVTANPSPRNYPYRCWWVAGFSEEVSRTLLGRWLLDTPVLLFRTEKGHAVAIENRCPHRATPLSLGQLVGDEVVCGYHGFQFNVDGRCTKIPSQAHVPPALGVRRFPTIEQPPFVWVYLGDPTQIDKAPAPPKLAWASDPEFARVSGRLPIAANYMSLKENVLDLTHFGYVHAKSFGITDWKEPPAVTVEGDVVTYRQVFTASPLAPIYAHAIGVAPGKPFDRDNYGSFVSPALQVAAVDFNDPDPAPGARDRFRLRICHATTPVDPHHMEYFWMMGRDHGTTPEMMERLRSGVMQGFKEDEAIIQAAQDMLRRAPFSAERPEFSVRADSAAVQARRALERWLSRE